MPARKCMERGISEEMVLEVIYSPQQTIPQGEEKVIYESIKYSEADDRNFLVRVFVNIIKQPNLVITVYRTRHSKARLAARMTATKRSAIFLSMIE